MAKLISIYWRDIPAQVVGRAGRRDGVKKELQPRFAKAIDRAAMRAGRGSSDAYLEDWRRESEDVTGDLQLLVDERVAALESQFDDEFLEAVVKAGGLIEEAKKRARAKDKEMTNTIISSTTKEVIIGFEQPFVVIGERINPTGRKLLAEEMKNGDYSRVESDALAQVAAGAHILDVNAGIPLADEPAILAESIKLIQSITDVPLCIDSSIVAALAAGLAVYEGKALLNSVTGEEERLEAVLPLVKKYGCAVIAISNDDSGISEDINVRFNVAKKIVERAQDYGIPPGDVVVDPLVMPIGAINTAGLQVMELVKRLCAPNSK